MRRLCPVPSVRRGAADDAGPSVAGLSAALAHGTRDVHNSSDALIRVRWAVSRAYPRALAALAAPA